MVSTFAVVWKQRPSLSARIGLNETEGQRDLLPKEVNNFPPPPSCGGDN